MHQEESIDEDARRSIADISLAELASVILDNRGLLDEADPARDLARLLGVERLAAVSRARLEEAIVRARDHISGDQPPDKYGLSSHDAWTGQPAFAFNDSI